MTDDDDGTQSVHFLRRVAKFWKYRSPWMIATALFAAFVARLVVGDWQITDAIVPVAMIAAFPFFE